MSNEFVKPFSCFFDLQSGLSTEVKLTKRFLSNMRGMFADDKALDTRISEDDSLVYEFCEMHIPHTAGDILFGTSITYPGKVGEEYFMTKGHFHEVLETAEVYYCLNGRGYLLMEDINGNWDVQELTPGQAVYVPKGYAHRSINTGSVPLVTFFAFRADAGHDYGSIEEKGFCKLIVEQNGKPVIVDNPKRK